MEPFIANPGQAGHEGERPGAPPGCLSVGVFIMFVLWCGGITTLYLIGQWITEQLLFEGSLGLPDFRIWTALGFSAGIILPLALAAAISKNSIYQRYYQVWLTAGVFSLVCIPTHLLPLTDWQANIGLKIVALALLILALNRNSLDGPLPVLRRDSDGASAIAFGLGLLLGLPWVIWGAAGSLLDTVLGIAAGITFGFAATKLVMPILDVGASEQNQVAVNGVSVLRQAVGISIGIYILAAGFTPVGMQFILPPSLGLLAFSMVGLSRWGISRMNLKPDPMPIVVLTSLAVIFPLVLIDGDELMFVIGSGPGELFSYAVRMVGLNLIVALLAGLAFFILRKQTEHASIPGRGWNAAAVCGLIPLVIIYGLAGQPGFHGERLFVVLQDQADLSGLDQIADPLDRRSAVFETLVNHSRESQASLRGQLDRLGIAYKPYYLVNGLEVRGGPLTRLWLSTRPEVDRILTSPYLRPLKEEIPVTTGEVTIVDEIPWNIKSIGADRVWEEWGVRGQGILIGQSDSGVDGSHIELADAYRGRSGDDDYAWYDPWYGSTRPRDLGGHGTHTLGSVMGNQVGVAPDAEWIGCVNLARNLANPAYYLECMQFMLAPFPQGGDAMADGDPKRGAQVLNNSWGCPTVEGCDLEIFEPAVKALRSAGIFVVVSAGNSGYAGCGSVDTPLAIYADVLTVGAVNASGNLAGFSSLGPVIVDGSNRVKPEILAPGELVLSAYPNGSYSRASGTSMAGPHLAGVVALLWSANPNLIGDIDTTTQILIETARPYQGYLPPCIPAGDDSTKYIGYGLVDAYQAVSRALETK